MGKGAKRRAHQGFTAVVMGTALRAFAHPTVLRSNRFRAFRGFRGALDRFVPHTAANI